MSSVEAKATTEDNPSFLVSIEKSTLRCLHYLLLNHLDPARTKSIVTSLLRMYQSICAHCPKGIALRMEIIVNTLAQHADKDFHDFWNHQLTCYTTGTTIASPRLSISPTLDPSPNDQYPQYRRDHPLASYSSRNCLDRLPSAEIHMLHLDNIAEATNNHDHDDVLDEDSLVTKMIKRVFGLTHYLSLDELCSKCILTTHVQTPLTSPDHGIMDRMVYSSSVPSKKCCSRGSGHCADSEHPSSKQDLVPGWAVSYMERESNLPKLVMQQMMHSAVPLNLFYAIVEYPDPENHESDEDLCCSEDVSGFMTPESFPPTPIARQYQTTRIENYTTAILDRASQQLQQMEDRK